MPSGRALRWIVVLGLMGTALALGQMEAVAVAAAIGIYLAYDESVLRRSAR
jgi:hypothetical protein